MTSAAQQDSSRTDRKTFSRTYEVNFVVNKSAIDTTFRNNSLTLNKMRHEIDSIISQTKFSADSISIHSTASPEGNAAYNLALSKRRGESIAKYIKGVWPELEPYTFNQTFHGEDWDTFWKIVERDKNIPFRDKIAAINNANLTPAEKEEKLRELKSGFFYILRNHAYQMRSSKVTFTYSSALPDLPILPKAKSLYSRLEAQEGNLAQRATPQEKPEEKSYDKKMIMAARTNLLVPALNVGIEVPIKTNWSVGIDYYFPWWLAKDNKHCSEMLGLFIDGKYWFGKNRTEKDKLTGHAIGIYAGAGYYDYQKQYSGYQGEYTDIGVDYTYAIPVGKKKRLRMEFNIGLGWIYTVARHYTPTDDFSELIKDPGIKHRKYNFFGPTRASVTFAIPIKVKTKKGGEK